MPNRYERNRYSPDRYGQNPYIRNQEGQFRQYYKPNRRGRRGKIRFHITGAGAAIIAVVVVAAGAVGFALARGGAPKATATPMPTETSAPVVVMPPDATAFRPSPSPISTEAPTPPPSPTPEPASAPPQLATNSPADAYFTAGDVQVDYANMLYRSADLYVKITNVQADGINYYVADCRAKDSNRLFTALAYDKFKVHTEEKTSVMANRKGAVIAISGDYYGAAASGSGDNYRNERGIVIRNGQLHRKSLWRDVAAIYQDGTMKTFDKSKITADRLMADGAVQAFSFGPMLLDENGKVFSPEALKDRYPRNNPANPRCAIGYIEPNHFVLVVVDGIRGETNKGFSKGMTRAELAQLFEDLGCKCAYNLDGGGTATMVFMGKVINHPCDNGGEERSVSDIIYFGESETDQANIERINNR